MVKGMNSLKKLFYLTIYTILGLAVDISVKYIQVSLHKVQFRLGYNSF